jgi:hypothetical protein
MKSPEPMKSVKDTLSDIEDQAIDLEYLLNWAKKLSIPIYVVGSGKAIFFLNTNFSIFHDGTKFRVYRRTIRSDTWTQLTAMLSYAVRGFGRVVSPADILERDEYPAFLKKIVGVDPQSFSPH